MWLPLFHSTFLRREAITLHEYISIKSAIELHLPVLKSKLIVNVRKKLDVSESGFEIEQIS